ncbi:MAG: hypothetical protein ABTQ32_33770 [Myxococcaceae bacterium]
MRERTCVTLFVPGTPKTFAAWKSALAKKKLTVSRGVLGGLGLDVPVEFVKNDGTFGAAFPFGTVETDQLAEVDVAPGALVLSVPVELHHGRKLFSKLAKALEACGALAIRIEQSKLGFAIARWRELMDADDPWALYRLAVVMLGGRETVNTCGMQVFSLPDAQLELDDETDAAAANDFLGSLNVYQLAEDPLLLTGHRFAPDPETPQRVLERWPDATYGADHACHNPFGVWRVGAPNSPPHGPDSLAYVFMPSLAAVLTAAEKKAGKKLTKKQVEKIRDEAPCMTMDHRDAQRLERKRGYADLEPTLAYEQWQVLRSRG